MLSAIIGSLYFTDLVQAQSETKTYRVVFITDGDSLIVSNGIHKIKVRMIGIDAPESFVNEKAQRDSKRSGVDTNKIVLLGKKSAQYLRQLLPVGSAVKLASDNDKFDKYGRTLAYVYNDRDEFLNLKMIADGYAYPYSVPPNLRYEEDFRKAFKKARIDKIGLWGE